MSGQIIQLNPEVVDPQVTLWTLAQPYVDRLLVAFFMALISALMVYFGHRCNMRRRDARVIRRERVRADIMDMVDRRLRSSQPMIEEIV
ncbi:hypothetical protein TYRP_009200 [Tyrophagus putrescentiae]|nr:hypothetical protein TYRP_009200 [Tyrophagus putrescentiae]